MIDFKHSKQVLNKFTWLCCWGLFALAFYTHRNDYHWGVWVFLVVSCLLAWNATKAAWNSWLYGRYQHALRVKSQTPTDNHGKAQLATEQQLEAAGKFDSNCGVPIGAFNGKPLFHKFTHAMVVSPAGAGKTSAVALPCLAHGYRVGDGNGGSFAASVVVTDIKGELAVMAARNCVERHGHKVFYLNPDEMFGFANSCFNPLQVVIDDLAYVPYHKYALSDAQELVLQLIPEPPEGDKNKYFRNGSRNMIFAVVLYLAAENPACCTLPELFRILSSAGRLKEVLEAAVKSDALSGDIALLASGLLEVEDDHFSDFITGAMQVLMPFSPSSPLAHSVSKSDFTFEALKQERTSVFIMARYDRKEAYAPWIGLVAKAAIKSLIRVDGNIPVHFLLDEATNIPLPGLSNDLTALRGYGLRCQIICQAKSELTRVYGKESTETFYSQTDLKQFFGVTSLQEAKEISAMLGDYTVKAESLGMDRTSPWSDLKDSISETGRPLMRPEEILNMPKDDQIVLINGLPPIYCKRLPYSQVDSWHSALDDNPLEGGKLPLDHKISIDYREVH